MFFYEKMSIPVILMGLFILAVLILINEITRRNKKAAIFMYIIVPIVFTIFVWPKTAGNDPSVNYWFPWIKTYSALAGVIGFMIIRYKEGMDKTKFAKIFPPLILIINILEAVYRDFECFSMAEGIVNDTWLIGGPWNIINGVAGIINIITITGFIGIYVSKKKSKDLMWPDQLWFWIIAYDLWNMSYIYNCIADRSFHVGFILILSATIPALWIKKGPWLQHRAQTLALYTMFTLTMPEFANTSRFALKSSHNTSALLILSLLSLGVNIMVLLFEIKTIRSTKRNPLKEDIYVDLKSYKNVIAEDK